LTYINIETTMTMIMKMILTVAVVILLVQTVQWRIDDDCDGNG